MKEKIYILKKKINKMQILNNFSTAIPNDFHSSIVKTTTTTTDISVK